MTNFKVSLLFFLLILVSIVVPIAVYAVTISFEFNPTGFFLGFWHGLIAPYTLIIRLLIANVDMYSCINSGWLYDFGFLVGILFSIPFGWIAVILALIFGAFA